MKLVRGLSIVVALAASASGAADVGISLVPGAQEVHWVPAPPSLPLNMKISMMAGDPAQPGPFTLRVMLPPNTVIAPHTHAQIESVTVLSGEIYHEMGETLDKSKGTLLRSGGFVSLPADMAHSVWSVRTAVLQVTGTGPFDLHYINPRDDPRNDQRDPRNKR